MSTSVIIGIVFSLLASLCGGVGCIAFALMILGFILLRRRGKKQVSAKEAMDAGVESVSQVFVRGKGGLQDLEDDDDDD